MRKALIVLGILAAALLALVLLFWIGARGVSSRPPTQAEKRLLVPASRLGAWGIADLKPGTCERYVAKRNLDGSLELEYEYDSDRDPESQKYLFFKSEAEINSSLDDATTSFRMQIVAYRTGMWAVRRRMEELPDLLSLGDQSYAAVIRHDEEPIGNIAVVRQGKIVHSLVIIGVYFSEPKDLEALLCPVLDQSKETSDGESPSTDPVIGVDAEDEDMNAAIERARATVDSFIARLQNPQPSDDGFSVKMTVEDGDEVEHFWVGDITYTDGSFAGTIGNDPQWVRNVRLGQAVQVKPEDITDWMFLDDGRLVGNFTLRVLLERMPEEQAKALREHFKMEEEHDD